MLFLRAQLNHVDITTHLERVMAAHERDVVGEFNPALDAVHGRVGFAAEIGESRDVHGDLVTARLLRETKVQPTAGDLGAEFIDGPIADGGVCWKVKLRSRD